MESDRRLKRRLEITLNSWATHLLILSVALSAAITLPRFSPGIPLSIDTTSHLYRILFLHEWFKRGVFPFWSPDWYGGSPALLLYPPLGYFAGVGVSMIGIDPLLSYKIIDALMYSLAPVSVYFLGREFGFPRGESALGALFFSVVPEVIENYLFFDRFPTVLSIPIFCIFLITFHRALTGTQRSIYIPASIITMSALLLTHHLSALIAGLVAVLMVVSTSLSVGLTRASLTLAALAGGTFAVTSFWLVPFMSGLGEFSSNEFFNRNVTFPFLRFLYFGFDVSSYLLGITQLVLAVVGMQSILARSRGRPLLMSTTALFSPLFLGMILFQAGESFASLGLRWLGQLAVIVSFVIFIGQFALLPRAKKMLERNTAIIYVLWFIIFLWVGLGYYALPIVWLPYVSELWIKTMDVYRIWLYLALPMSILAARGLVRLILKFWFNQRLALLLLALVIAPVTIGVALKVDYAFSAHVNDVLPYTAANAEIPAAIIDYFQHDSSTGRILGINVPFWIYLLPPLVHKPIVDGWYPQTKLVTQLVDITDYRIDDLETAPNQTARLNTWRSLIDQGDLLDITWVMIGGRSLANDLMTNTEFSEKLAVPYRTFNGTIDLMLFKAVTVPSFVESDPSYVGLISNVARPSPDRIQLTLNPPEQPTRLVVKEAYFPTWSAIADGQPLLVDREVETGYIVLWAPAGTHEIVLFHQNNLAYWNLVSVMAFFACFALAAVLFLRQRRSAG